MLFKETSLCSKAWFFGYGFFYVIFNIEYSYYATQQRSGRGVGDMASFLKKGGDSLEIGSYYTLCQLCIKSWYLKSYCRFIVIFTDLLCLM